MVETWEWVADWDEEASDCSNWPADYGDDVTCVGRGSGEASTRFPGAMVRGGSILSGADAGPFAVRAIDEPLGAGGLFGFRGAR